MYVDVNASDLRVFLIFPTTHLHISDQKKFSLENY